MQTPCFTMQFSYWCFHSCCGETSSDWRLSGSVALCLCLALVFKVPNSSQIDKACQSLIIAVRLKGSDSITLHSDVQKFFTAITTR